MQIYRVKCISNLTQVLDFTGYNSKRRKLQAKWLNISRGAFALHQNKGNPEGVRNTVLNIVQHAYGEHGQCTDWCQFRKDLSAKYKSLPGGLALEGDSQRLVLNNVFAIYAQNDEKLAPCGSTLANESFNNSVASKAPKARHYSGSESFDFNCISPFIPRMTIIKFLLTMLSWVLEVPFLQHSSDLVPLPFITRLLCTNLFIVWHFYPA